MMPGLPFGPFEQPLKDVLRRRYISRVARWLLGKDADSILAQAGNSAWEAAFAIRFFASARDIFLQAGEEQSLCEVIPVRIALVVRWLLSLQRQMEAPGYTSWEGVTWDTAIVTQGILAVSEFLTEAEQGLAKETAVKSCRWLLVRFREWDQAKYPWGAADIAQILSTLIYVFQRFPQLYRLIDDDYAQDPSVAIPSLFTYMAEYLLQGATVEPLAGVTDGKPPMGASWEDGFNTASAASALATYYALLISTPNAEPRIGAHEHEAPSHKHLHQVRQTLTHAYNWFESVHSEDGTWGTTYDTMPILKAYVELPALTEMRRAHGSSTRLLDAQPHFVFKTVRWMCDEKQVFWDGSFQHTDLTTIFYADALISIHNHWPPAAASVGAVYDDVVWASPMRTAPERSQRLALEVQALELSERNDGLKAERDYWHSKTQEAERRTNRIVLIGLFSVLAIVTSWVAAVDLGLLTIQAPLSEIGNLLQFIGVAAAIYAAVCGIIWNFPVQASRIPPDKRP